MKAGIELIRQLNLLMSYEDLSDEQLWKAAESLLPNLCDYLNGCEAYADGAILILKERQEQIEKHGFDVNRDSQYYSENELIKAALFAINPQQFEWPYGWDEHFRSKIIKKSNAIERLKVAGALIAAEIDRLKALTPTK